MDVFGVFFAWDHWGALAGCGRAGRRKFRFRLRGDSLMVVQCLRVDWRTISVGVRWACFSRRECCRSDDLGDDVCTEPSEILRSRCIGWTFVEPECLENVMVASFRTYSAAHQNGSE